MITAFVIFASIILIPATSAFTSTNWDVTVSNGSLFCDSTSKSSTHAQTLPYSSSCYHMSIHAYDMNSLSMTHSLSTEDLDLNSNTVLSADSAIKNKVLLQESVGMRFIGSREENATVCFRGSSELTAFADQIEFASSTIVNETSSFEHSVTSEGSGDFRLSTSSYKIAGTVNESFTVVSTRSRLNIYDADFAVTSYFQDPICIPSIPESEFFHSLCPYSHEP